MRKKKKEDIRGWEILIWGKKGTSMGEREEINEKKIASISQNFPTTQLLTSITSTKFDVK